MSELNLDEKRDIALKAYDLLKSFEYVEFRVFNEQDDFDDKGSGFVELDGVTFFFDKNGCIEKTDLNL